MKMNKRESERIEGKKERRRTTLVSRKKRTINARRSIIGHHHRDLNTKKKNPHHLDGTQSERRNSLKKTTPSPSLSISRKTEEESREGLEALGKARR